MEWHEEHAIALALNRCIILIGGLDDVLINNNLHDAVARVYCVYAGFP